MVDQQIPMNQTGEKPAAVSRRIEALAPGYFALVMATGIVSIGLHLVHIAWASITLLVIAAIAYVALWILYLVRAVRFRSALMQDARDPGAAFGYFTIVAGTNVLAVRLLLEGIVGVALVLILIGAALWVVLGYLIPWQVLMRANRESPVLSRVDGTWFVWAVASQSVAIALSAAEPHLGQETAWGSLFAVGSWAVGVVLYAWVAMLVLLRIIQYGLTPRDATPPFWIAMGGMAITVVAGNGVVGMTSAPAVEATRTIIEGTILLCWGLCAWLIPLLIGVGVWRHLVHRVPLTYSPGYWSMVFPIGMFAVASIDLGRLEKLAPIESIGVVVVAIACIAWVAVFIGMLRPSPAPPA